MKKMRVPFFPKDMFLEDKEIIYKTIYEAGITNNFILKDNVKKLEEEAKKYTGAKDAIAVHSGTGAVSLSLRAIGVGPGDEVITQGYCCQPVASEVDNLGATPIFVDIDPDTLVMDPSKIKKRITSKTKVILPAHLFSCLVDMPEINKIAKEYGLKVIEDACVQQGALLNGKAAGLLGDLGTWSFFQMKVMGGCGEGGMILTNDEELAYKCRLIRNHGQESRFNHKYIGVNSRMDEIMAGYLLHRFENLDRILKRRLEIATYYNKRFSEIEDKIKLPPKNPQGRCYYMYTIRSKDRNSLQEFLLNKGIATHVYYPKILPEQKAFINFRSSKDDLKECIKISQESISIPIYPNLTDQQAKIVADTIIEFYKS